MAKDLTWIPSLTPEEIEAQTKQEEWTWFDSTVDNASDELIRALKSVEGTKEYINKYFYFTKTWWWKCLIWYIPNWIKEWNREIKTKYLVEADYYGVIWKDKNWIYFTYKNWTKNGKKYIIDFNKTKN